MKNTLRRLAVVVLIVAIGIGGGLAYLQGRLADAAGIQMRLAAKGFPAGSQASRAAGLAAYQRLKHPMWRDLTAAQIAARMVMFAARLTHHLVANDSAQSLPPLAPFLGNFTGITSPDNALVLQRQPDCSLTEYSGSYTLNATSPAITIKHTTPHYEQILHSEAQLTTTAGTFPHGCADAKIGTSAQRATYLGKTSQNLNFFASAGYDPAANSNALYYGTVDASTQAIHAFKVDTSQPAINGVTSGDLNGDGLADLISVEQYGSSAGVGVWLAHPDGTLDPVVSYPVTGVTDESAVVDDFNGDGKLDVVVAVLDSSGNESIALLLGKGDGTLGSPVLTPLGKESAKIVNLISANLQGNAKDVVCSNGVVLLNDGHGNFIVQSAPAFPATTATNEFSPNLAAGDVNRDGKQDIVLNNGSEVQIYLSNGDGTFTSGTPYATINNVGYVTVADLDGDGNPDIYVGLAHGGFFGGDQFEVNNAYALMGNGDGTFRGAPIAPVAANGQNLADLNGDKIPDFVMVNGTTITPEIGNGDGTFKAGAPLSVATFDDNGATESPNSLVYTLADVNGDGAPDLVMLPDVVDTHTQRGFYLISLNRGDGTFSALTANILPNTASGSDFVFNETASAVQAADVNHDGKQDLILTISQSDYQSAQYQQEFLILLGRGDGTFTTGTPIFTYNSQTATTLPPTSLAAAVDLNGDGYADLVAVQSTGVSNANLQTQWQVFLNAGDGTFQTPVQAKFGSNPITTNAYEQTPFAFVDMNGDGHPDIVTISQDATGQAGTLDILLGDGTGNFTQKSSTTLTFYDGGGFSSIAVADFNGDGKNDVGFSSVEGSGIFLGNGDGTVQVYTDSGGTPFPSQNITPLSYGTAIAADFNHDGLPDLLLGDVILLNLGKNVPAGGGGTGGSGVTASTTSVKLSAGSITAGMAETLTASVSGPSGGAVPTGTVTFLDGSTSLGTANLTSSGSATLSMTNLAVGSHSITAQYAGDSTYAGSTSTAVTVTVTAVAANFSIAMQPASGSASATSGATTSLKITPTGGFSAAVSFSCSGLPPGYSCTFKPQTVTPTGAVATTTMTIGATKTAMLDRQVIGSSNRLLVSFAGGGLASLLLLTIFGRRTPLSPLVIILVFVGLAAGLIGLAACGSGSSKHTSSVTVTATAGSISHPATFTLTTSSK